VSGRGDEADTEGCEMCVIPCEVGDRRFSGNLKVRQYVCSGVSEEGRAANLTCAMAWTSAAMLKFGCKHRHYRDMVLRIVRRNQDDTVLQNC
jgi:hypothetical protein